MVVKAVYDGEVFRPTGPVPALYRPGDEFELTLTLVPPSPADDGDHPPPKLGEPGSAMQYLLWASKRLDGDDLPADYSTNWEKYLREEGH